MKRSLIKDVVNDFLFIVDFGDSVGSYIYPSLQIGINGTVLFFSPDSGQRRIEVGEDYVKVSEYNSYQYLNIEDVCMISLSDDTCIMSNNRDENENILLVGIKKEVK